jgi:hypothetical protein
MLIVYFNWNNNLIYLIIFIDNKKNYSVKSFYFKIQLITNESN